MISTVNQFVCNVSCHVNELSVIVFLFVTFGLLEIFGMTLFKLRIEIILSRKSLKISKGQSKTVYRRRTDNTMAKRKSTKGHTTIDKTYI
jgi:hypothetical protein